MLLGASPRIERRNAGRLEIADISRRDRHAVHEGRGRDQRVALGARVRNVEARTAPGDRCIHRQDSAFESRQYLLVHPFAQDGALRGILPFDLQHAKFEFQHRDRREVEIRNGDVACPRQHDAVGLVRASKLGQDVGVENEGHLRSAAR